MGSARFFPSKADLIGAKFQVSLSNEVLIDVAILLGKKELSFIRALTLRHGTRLVSGLRRRSLASVSPSGEGAATRGQRSL